jgi:hypothetical protein
MEKEVEMKIINVYVLRDMMEIIATYVLRMIIIILIVHVYIHMAWLTLKY